MLAENKKDLETKEDDLNNSLIPTKAKLPLKGYIFQYALALSASLGFASGGSCLGWPSPSLPILMAENSPIPITSEQSSWVVLFLTIGTFVSPVAVLLMMDRFGRKITLICASVPLIIGWILIYVAESVEVLYVSRLLSGITYGTVYSVTPMYLGEIASDSIRGSIGTLTTVMNKSGVLFVYAIGPFVSIKLMALIALALPIFFVSTLIWFPESPYFLLGRNRENEARRGLSRLRGRKDVQLELEEMKEAVKLSQQNKGTIRELFMAGNRRALIICIGLSACQQLSGSQPMIVYSQIIFERIGANIKASEASIIMAVIQLVTAGVASLTVDRYGRRPLLIFSASGTLICNFIVGLYFFLIRVEVDVSSITWLPLLAIMVYITAYNLGLSTVVFPILGEVFPKHLKALAGCTFTVGASLFVFIVVKLFQTVSDNLGSDFAFWGLTIFSIFILLFICYMVPETKGKPLHVILEELNGKKK